MSGQPVEFHPEALAEAEAALAWYQERSPRAAELFATELDKAIEAISDAPHPRWASATPRLGPNQHYSRLPSAFFS